ncbi:hypothetical protein L5L78_20360 [Shewanella sp. SM34]|uniref:hypothetical protein n=1 Tax=unclassified Shewanella TaxID=196818 RepID=UPI0021DA7B11|nr:MULTISPECIES: hypothetical protein [unclassified Shewanella]MCU8058494.1 hypothetical protein [Shewanella sp. SM35]MCU8067446.1 hypothetical protein [Shewanella sp. SM34]
MKSGILHALEKSLDRIYNNYPVENEIDFQSVLFGELYKQFPDAIIRFEHRLKSDYQSYARRGSITKNRKSRVDLHLSYASQTIVIELKYFKGSSLEERTDMLADIAKVERIVEAKEANEGFCIHLIKEGIISRLPSEIETKKYEMKVGRWDYNFEIKGIYEVNSTKALCGRSFIVHHIK